MSEFTEMKVINTWYAQVNIDAIKSTSRAASANRIGNTTWTKIAQLASSLLFLRNRNEKR